MRGVKVYSAKGASITRGVGIFSRAFMDRFPLVPVEDEERLQEYSIRENFIERVFVYRRWLDLIQPGHTINELISFHTDHKYLILSHSVNHLRELGAIVSNGKKNHRSQLFDRYHHILMDGLRLMATVKKHTNVLQHMAGYLKNQLTTWEKAELQEIITRYHGGLVPLIVPITLIKHYVKKYDEPYLKRQYYLNPHSMELMLRNHV